MPVGCSGTGKRNRPTFDWAITTEPCRKLPHVRASLRSPAEGSTRSTRRSCMCTRNRHASVTPPSTPSCAACATQEHRCARLPAMASRSFTVQVSDKLNHESQPFFCLSLNDVRQHAKVNPPMRSLRLSSIPASSNNSLMCIGGGTPAFSLLFVPL